MSAPYCFKVGSTPKQEVEETVEIPALRVAVIGSAGRKDDEAKFTKEVYIEAFGMLAAFISDMNKVNPVAKIELISGGAAYADHLAVQFFLTQFFPCSLTLYLPTQFANGEFEDDGTVDFRTNPGGTMNFYHRKFSKNLNLNSRNEIDMAIKQGAKVVAGGGLHGRNNKVAEEADVVIAFTFGNGAEIKDGGTLDTCKKFLKKNSNDLLYHVDLHNPTVIH